MRGQSGHAAPMDAGTIVADRFEIEHKAAAGGMGAVYHAKDRVTGKPAAIKVVRTEGTDNAERLLREARALAELDHPHVVRYLGHGSTPSGDPFLAMEWVQGETLSKRLGRTPLSVREALAIVLQVAEALGHAHAKGIIHRDVKPGNVILRNGEIDEVVLVDFGVARTCREEGLTMTGMIVGTPAFMAPEQARGSRAIAPSADVFALGCLLYRCLTGRNAFEAENQVAVLAKVLLDDPPPLAALLGGVEPELDALVRALLSKDPGKRPLNGSAAAEAIRNIAKATRDGSRRAAAPAERLTLTERRLVSLVLAPAPADPEATLVGDDVRGGLQPVREVAKRHGAVCEVLANGTLVIALSGRGSATDQAAHAARVALDVKAVLAKAPIVLVTGRAVVDAGELSNTSGITRSGSIDVFQHAATLLSSLSKSAQADAVVVDEATAGLLDRSFVIGPHPLGLELRGVRVDAGDGARLLGKITACVGREREIATLEALLAECASEPIARAALVTAPPGMGKSRLLRELLRRVAGRVEIMRAACDAFATGSPFAAVAQIVKGAAAIESDDPPEARVRKLRARIARHVSRHEVDRVCEFLGEACGIVIESARLLAARSDPRLMSEQVRAAFIEWMDAECKAGPLLLAVDDVQWGDAVSIRLLADALSTLAEAPLCILLLGRPEANESLPDAIRERAVPVPLAALSKKASERLVREALEDAPDEIVSKLVSRAGGQPLLLEELVRAHAEGHDGGSETAAVAMVQSRLETLDAESRRVLRAASVFGEVFWRGGVEHLLSTNANAQFDILESKELIAKRPSSRLAGDSELSFRHALVRDAAYEMLTPEDAALGHRLAAEWLESKGSVDPAVLAEHWARSDRPNLAISHLVRAAEIALEAGDFQGVHHHAARARSIGVAGQAHGALLQLEAEAFRWAGNNLESEELSFRALDHLVPASAAWFNALRVAAFTSGSLGHVDRLNGLVQMLLEVHPVGEAAERAWRLAANQAAINAFLASPGPRAEQLLQHASAVSAEMLERDPVLAMHHFHAQGTAMFRRGDYERLLEMERACVEHARRAGDARFAAFHVTNIGFALAQLGDFEDALDLLTAARIEALHHKLGTGVLVIDQNMGYVLMLLGRLDEAREIEEQVVEDAEGKIPRIRAVACACLARIHLRQGSAHAAIAAAERAVQAAPTDTPRVYGYACLAEAQLAAGMPDKAIESSGKALDLARGIGGCTVGDIIAGRAAVEALVALGQKSEAARALETPLAMVQSRAAMVRTPRWRKGMLERVEDNRAILELADKLLGARALGA